MGAGTKAAALQTAAQRYTAPAPAQAGPEAAARSPLPRPSPEGTASHGCPRRARPPRSMTTRPQQQTPGASSYRPLPTGTGGGSGACRGGTDTQSLRGAQTRAPPGLEPDPDLDLAPQPTGTARPRSEAPPWPDCRVGVWSPQSQSWSSFPLPGGTLDPSPAGRLLGSPRRCSLLPRR